MERLKITLILWDSAETAPDCLDQVYTWNGFTEKKTTHSLLRYVEIHGERLRKKYLAWIHELGEYQIDGLRIIDHLAFKDGLSYWWLTLLVEKSPWKSPSITHALRLLALEEIVVQQKPRKLRLVSTNQNLHKALNILCQNLNIAYEWERLPNETWRGLSIRNVCRTLPYPVQALVHLVRHLYVHWPLKQAPKTGWFGGNKAVFFCSYFNNVDPKIADQSFYHSYYWGSLHVLLNRIGCQQNWLQWFIPCTTVPTALKARRRLKHINQHNPGQQFHAFLDTYLSWHIILRVLKNWLWLCLLSWRMSKIQHAFRIQESQLSLWPIMREDWDNSMCGPVAINNLLFIELFDKALSDLPHQQRGFYLCENQAWERALIHAWRKYGHGQLIAVQHSLVRFWDLRYFADSRTLRHSKLCPIPQADCMALNGKMAMDAYISMGYPKEDIIECEALRYDWLCNFRTSDIAIQKKRTQIKVLILGDYMPSGMTKMMRLLEFATPKIAAPVVYTIKPHPNWPVRAEDYPTLNLKVVMSPLGEILQDFDIAYCSNLTSAAVDAYVAGIPVVVFLDETTLNFSPLRGHPGVSFINNPNELANILLTEHYERVKKQNDDHFFFLDPELSRWARVLGN